MIVDAVIVDALEESDRLPALLGDREEELSPELALVDPDAAQRAREALPDITLTEVRLSQARAIERSTRPRAGSVRAAAAVAPVIAAPPPVPGPAPAPASAQPAAPPPPSSYEDLRRVFEEPAPTRRRLGRSVLAALLVVGVAAGIALALPRALDRRDSQAVGGPGPHASTAAGQTRQAARNQATGRGHAKARAHTKAKGAPRTKAAVHKARRTAHPSKRHASAPPVASKPARKHRRAAGRRVRPAIPDFVWVPANAAGGYLIEFRSGSKLVLRTRTKAARLHVAKRQLRPGRYRWYVWPLDRAGKPVGKPLVDSAVRIR